MSNNKNRNNKSCTNTTNHLIQHMHEVKTTTTEKEPEIKPKKLKLYKEQNG